MAFTGFRKVPRNPCIICRTNEGTISTRDGLVCEYCMPMDLLKSAGTISADRIILYQRVHKNWKSCFTESPDPVKETISEDRSMAITLSDDIILCDELNNQIRTSESIDLVVSFIIMSGLNLIMDALRDFTRRGKLRVITTAYMGVTEFECLQELSKLPNTEIRMELNASYSHLHAKSYIFNRDGKSTAYVGSANISKTALTSGEEWVVKLREQDVPLVLEDIRRGYEALWNSGHLKQVNEMNRAEIESALDKHGM